MSDALRTLYPQIIQTRGELAFDINGNPVSYDANAVQTQLATMQAAEVAAQQAAATAKASALAKLTALGLTADEITALIG